MRDCIHRIEIAIQILRVLFSSGTHSTHQVDSIEGSLMLSPGRPFIATSKCFR